MHLPLTLLAFASAVSAQTVTLAQLLASENTTLSVLNGLLATQPDLLAALTSAQNITLLAPSNGAFDKLLATPAGKAAASDLTQTNALLSYHVLNGLNPGSAFTSTPAFFPTLLTNPSFTAVTGGQVVAGFTQNSKVIIQTGLKERSTVQTADLQFSNGVMHIIDTVLTVPISPSYTAVDSNLTALAGALTTTSLVTTVDGLKDVTIFAPSNAAFQAIGSATGSLTTQQLASILTYHVINGTVGYSPLLTSGLANESFPTVNGGEVTVLVESGKVFVNSAQVTITDIIVANGVMHVLDNVLNPANSTATPIVASPTQGVAFAGAASASVVPFTTGIVPTTTAPSASTNTNAAPGRGGKRGEIGVAALFGAGVVGMAVL